MHSSLNAIFQRRAIRVFDPVEISPTLRDELLEAARRAPSSFNSQPYRLLWVSSCDSLRMVAQLWFSQPPAETASVLVVAVADIGAWRSTTLGQLEWMRASGFSPEKIAEFERKSKLAKWFFIQGWRNLLGTLKWLAFRTINLFKIIGMPPVTRQGFSSGLRRARRLRAKI